MKIEHNQTIWFCRDSFFGHVILRRHDCFVSMLEVLLVLCQYGTFILNLSDLNIHTTIKKNYIKIMPSSTPHQKFCFYHLPTRGRAGIKLGDASYVSNVSIIFYYSMLYYLLFWTLLGFIIYFYIIFGTNLLTGGPAQNCYFFFACFRISKKNNIKWSPNGMKPSGTWFSHWIQHRRLGPYVKPINRRPRGRGARRPPVAPPTYFFLLYISTYLQTIRYWAKTLIPPP